MAWKLWITWRCESWAGVSHSRPGFPGTGREFPHSRPGFPRASGRRVKPVGGWEALQRGTGREFPTPVQVSLGLLVGASNPLEGGKPYNGALVGSFPLPPRFPSGFWSARQTRWRVGNPATGHWSGVSHSRPGFPRASGRRVKPVGGWETLQRGTGREFPTPVQVFPGFLSARRTRWRVGNPTTGHWAGVSHSRPGFPPWLSHWVGAANPLEGGKPYNGALVGSFPLPPRFPSGFWSARQTRWRVGNPATGHWSGVSHSRPGFPRASGRRVKPVGGWEALQRGTGREFPTPVQVSLGLLVGASNPLEGGKPCNGGLKTTTSYYFKGISLIPCRN